MYIILSYINTLYAQYKSVFILTYTIVECIIKKIHNLILGGRKMKKLTVGFGMLRDLDPLGRVCIPKEMRKMFHLENEVEVIVTEEGVLVRNPKYVLIEREEYERIKSKAEP